MKAPLIAAIMLSNLAVAGIFLVWTYLNLSLGMRRGSWWQRNFIDPPETVIRNRMIGAGAVTWLIAFLVLYL